jgi:hypothetical protein
VIRAQQAAPSSVRRDSPTSAPGRAPSCAGDRPAKRARPAPAPELSASGPAPRSGSPRSHICAATGLTSPASAPGSSAADAAPAAATQLQQEGAGDGSLPHRPLQHRPLQRADSSDDGLSIDSDEADEADEEALRLRQLVERGHSRLQ